MYAATASRTSHGAPSRLRASSAAAKHLTAAATAPLSGTPEELWLRAARFGLDDPQLAAAAVKCFAAADEALSRLGAPCEVRDAVAAYTNRYVLRGRCPADDLLDEARRVQNPAQVIRFLHDIRLPDDNLPTLNQEEHR